MRRIKKVPLFYFYEKSVKKSSFGGPGGSAQNPRKNGPKHTFFLLYRRKIGQKVVKTWSESRAILIFQGTPGERLLCGFLLKNHRASIFIIIDAHVCTHCGSNNAQRNLFCGVCGREFHDFKN